MKPLFLSSLAALAMLPLVGCTDTPTAKEAEPVVAEANEVTIEADAEQDENQLVQQAMKDYVNTLVSANDGVMPMLHEGKVLKLELKTSEKYPDAFHEGVQKVGNLYTSCADFIDPTTQDLYDIDFLVSKSEGGFTVVQPLVHSKNGVKSPYDLEHS